MQRAAGFDANIACSLPFVHNVSRRYARELARRHRKAGQLLVSSGIETFAVFNRCSSKPFFSKIIHLCRLVLYLFSGACPGLVQYNQVVQLSVHHESLKPFKLIAMSYGSNSLAPKKTSQVYIYNNVQRTENVSELLQDMVHQSAAGLVKCQWLQQNKQKTVCYENITL
jgi:hypothetical protein